MTAISQSYPNYLGGLNEQPDELKKPGQLVKALNVIPDPTIGLARRPGFELVEQSKVAPGEPDVLPDPEGTWFEMEFPNEVNEDYIYYGNIREDGQIVIFNQDGQKQAVRYTDKSAAILPHKKYLYNNNKLEVLNDSGEVLDTVDVSTTTKNGYFKHRKENPLKYCVSRGHVIITNPDELPTLSKPKAATNSEKESYYSFLNLKLIDTANYSYIFSVYGNQENYETFDYITEVETTEIDDILSDYDTDTLLPLQTDGPWLFELGIEGENGITEVAEVEVEFRGQVVQLKSGEGDGYRNEARYSWSTQIITEGKGYKEGQYFQNVLPGVNGLPDLTLTFVINETKTVTEAVGVKVKPEVTGDMGAEEILQALQSAFAANDRIDKALIVGNGIYMEGTDPFSISTAEIAVADVMNSQKIKDDVVPLVRINTTAELPVECFAGFRVEVTNSFDDQNNYYLEYVAESQTVREQTNTVDTKSDGYWEEIAKPFEPHAPRVGTLPHMITLAREADQSRFVFIVSPIKYARRTAGTENDNPTFFRDNVRITSLNYYKNRLFFFTSGGTVISSKAGKIEDLFLDTAINVSVIDPIDVIANNNQRVPIYGSAIVNNGMVLFGDSEQYMLTTNSDILSSETVSVTKVANYTFDPLSNPIYLGANLGFVSAGVSRFYEMTNLYERGPVDINERSQQIQNAFGQGFNMPVSSREQSLVLVYKSGARSPNMRLYKFRQESSQESSQTAWVRWQVDKAIAYASMPKDKIYLFVKDDELGCKIYKMNTINALNYNGPDEIPPQYTDGHTADTPGVEYTTRIEFPTIYAMNGDKADMTANLTIHRVKLSTGEIGAYRLQIEREGYDDYLITVEQTPASKYKADDEPTLLDEKIETVPVYTRNKNLRLVMVTEYDAPLTLKSMTWEGDYNRPYYKSV